MNKNRNFFLSVVTIGSVAALSSLPANAYIITTGSSSGTFTVPDEAFNEFVNLAGGSVSGTADFEGETVGDQSIMINIGGVDTTIGSMGFGGVQNSPFNNARNTTRPLPDNEQYYLGGVSPGGEQNFAISTAEPVAGLGFYGTDIGDFQATLAIRTFLGDQLVDTSTPDIVNVDGNLLFWSILGEGEEVFDRVELDIILDPGQNVNGDSFGIDDISLLAAGGGPGPSPIGTPEPGTLIGLGLLGTAGFVSRRQRK